MRKTIRDGTNRRAVYKFDCKGGCGKRKNTYVYDRAKKGVCLSCERNKPNENQASLFDQAIDTYILGLYGDVAAGNRVGTNGEILRDFEYPLVSGEIKRIANESRMKALNPLIQSDSHKRDIKYLASVAES